MLFDLVSDRRGCSKPVEHIATKGRSDRLFGSRNVLARCRLERDRKSTRLNSSHTVISYAVFCLKKKDFVLRRLDDEALEKLLARAEAVEGHTLPVMPEARQA